MRLSKRLFLLLAVLLSLSALHSLTADAFPFADPQQTQQRGLLGGGEDLTQAPRSVLVSTVDGSLHAVNLQTGEKRWSLDSLTPLVESFAKKSFPSTSEPGAEGGRGRTSTSRELSNPSRPAWWENELPFAIPGTDGKLYHASPVDGLLRMHVSVADIVAASPLQDSDSLRYVGSKRTKVFLIDEETGHVHKAFDPDQSSPFDSEAPELDLEDALWIWRTDLSVHALDSQTGDLWWNVSVGEYSSHRREQPEVRRQGFPPGLLCLWMFLCVCSDLRLTSVLPSCVV